MKRSILFFTIIACSAVPFTAAAQESPVKSVGDAPLETVIVTGEKELPAILHGFVQSYTMPATSEMEEITRWRSGICPKTYGFASHSDNDFVTLRVRQIAALVGAPMAAPPCKTNIEIYFASQPQELMDGIRANGGSELLASRASKAARMATFVHPIQAWYATATRDICGTIRFDNDDEDGWDGILHEGCPPANSGMKAVEGSRLRTGLNNELAHIYIVADVKQTAGYRFSAVADYIAMLALSQTGAFATCLGMPSVINLTAPDCDAAKKVDVVSDTDLAYLRGVYTMDPGANFQTQQSDIVASMQSALGH